MTHEALLLEKEGPVATVTLNRPEVGNAFDMKLGAELDSVTRDLSEDRDV